MYTKRDTAGSGQAGLFLMQFLRLVNEIMRIMPQKLPLYNMHFFLLKYRRKVRDVIHRIHWDHPQGLVSLPLPHKQRLNLLLIYYCFIFISLIVSGQYPENPAI